MTEPWRMPAEWAPHAACWIAWPCREVIWGLGVDAAKRAYAEVIAAISAYEPVRVLVNPAQRAEAEHLVTAANVTFIDMPLNDSWARDIMPLFIRNADSQGAVAFRFNAWGNKFTPFDQDAALAPTLTRQWASERPGFVVRNSSLILEGGSIHVDGEGTLLTTRECLLHPNRNPDLGQADIEAELQQQLGVEHFIWLPHGLWGDTDTDGHVDNIATFTRPGRILTMTTDDSQDANYWRYRKNRATLEAAWDVRGRSLSMVEIPQPKRVEVAGEPLALSYVNYYLANGAVIIPAFDQPDHDQEAFRLIQQEFPERDVIQVDALPILAGGGGIHCITMQEPSDA